MGLSVLLAADDFGLSRVLEEILRAEGHTVAVASNGLVALDLALAVHPDLLICDDFLQPIDGYRLLRLFHDNLQRLASRSVLINSMPLDAYPQIERIADAAIARDRPERISEDILDLIGRLFGSDPPEDAFIHLGKAHSPRAVNRIIFDLKNHRDNLYEALGEAVVQTDENARVINANAMACAALGREEKELVGIDLRHLLGLPSDHPISLSLTGLLNGPVRSRLRLGHSERIYIATLSALRLGERPPQRLLVLDDMTEIERAREAERKSRHEFEQVFKAAACALCLVGPKREILRANDKFVEMTGLSSDEVIGAKCSDVVGGEECGTARCLWLKAFNSEYADSHETERNVGGEKRCMRVSSAPLHGADGSFQGMILDFQDVTQQRRLEAVAEAENMASNIGHLFSGLRHEIGNPINSLKIAATVLRNNLGEFSRETIEEYTQRMLEDIGRVEFLLKALKSYSMHENPEPVLGDIVRFFNGFFELIRGECRRSGIVLHKEIEFDSLTACFDPRALHQVLLSIYTNAVEALRDTIEPAIYFRIIVVGNDAVLAIEDNGSGIPEENLMNLFNPLLSCKGDGRGFGLSISRKLMAKMDGTIGIESTTGERTVVTLRLPRTCAGMPDE